MLGFPYAEEPPNLQQTPQKTGPRSRQRPVESRRDSATPARLPQSAPHLAAEAPVHAPRSGQLRRGPRGMTSPLLPSPFKPEYIPCVRSLKPAAAGRTRGPGWGRGRRHLPQLGEGGTHLASSSSGAAAHLAARRAVTALREAAAPPGHGGSGSRSSSSSSGTRSADLAAMGNGSKRRKQALLRDGPPRQPTPALATQEPGGESPAPTPSGCCSYWSAPATPPATGPGASQSEAAAAGMAAGLGKKRGPLGDERSPRPEQP